MKKLLSILIIVFVAMAFLNGCQLLDKFFGPSSVPATPTNLTVKAGTSTSLTVSWNAVSSATSYQVYRDQNASGSFSTQEYSGTNTNFIDKGLVSGTTYFYEVRATNSLGSSPLSSAVSGTPPSSTSSVRTITTIAGSGIAPGYSANKGAGTSAYLSDPTGLAADSSGNLYIADTLNMVIRKLGASGIITTVAGNGQWGYGGDGGPATSAELVEPTGTAIDTAGDLYVADGGNYVVRKIAPSGTISTVAGNGQYGYTGDGGQATSAELGYVAGVAVDSNGNLYIADQNNNVVRKVTPSGVITTYAGDGTVGYTGDGGPATAAQLSGPSALAVDSSGNLYIADDGNNVVREVNAATGVITTVAGDGTAGYSGDGGPATSAEINSPSGIAIDSAGNLYIADEGNNVIRKVTSTGTITTYAGNGTAGYTGDGGSATNAEIDSPTGIAIGSADNLYISDPADDVIRKVTTAGTISTVAGHGIPPGYSSNNGAATSAVLNGPNGVAVDGSGNLYFVGADDQIVREVTPSGTITTIAGMGTMVNGALVGNGGPATSASLSFPHGVAVDSSGNVYIADTGSSMIRKVSPSGIITAVAGNLSYGYSGDGGAATSAELADPMGVAVDSAGNIYIADTDNNVIRKVTPSGIITTIAGNGTAGYSGDGGPATNAELNNPWGVAVDGSGNIYIADTNNAVIRKVTPAGIITTVAGDGTGGYSGDGGPATSAELGWVDGIAVDSAGNLYIADGGNNRIRMVTPSGTITTIVGTGTAGYSGDGGSATSALLNQPSGVAVDSSGNLYIADMGNNAVRKVSK